MKNRHAIRRNKSAGQRHYIMFHFSNKTGDFFIQLKGTNAGQVLKEKIPNSVGILCERHYLVPEYAFWLFTSFFILDKYQPKLKGSVIPFITQNDIKAVFIDFLISKHAKS